MTSAEYYQRFNTKLFEVLPPNLPRVLEIGCGAGALADRYKSLNPGTRWFGVEPSPQAAAVAHTRLDMVLVSTVEQAPFEAFGPEPFDALVCGDVLEHLIDPEAALRRLVGLLKPGGMAYISLPNVQHWSILLQLLRGRWDYTDEGLLDRTHLRFFTLDTAWMMIGRCNLRIVEAKVAVPPAGDPVVDGWEVHKDLLGDLQALAVKFGKPDSDVRRFMSLQYIIRAEKVG